MSIDRPSAPPVDRAPALGALAAPPAGGAAPRLGRGRLLVRRFLRRRAAVVGLVLLVLLVLLAVFGDLFTAYSYADVDFTALTSPPSPDHVLGTTAGGNDVYAQAVHGLGRSLVIAVVVSLLTTGFAAVVGSLAAYVGGRVERAVLGVTHFLMIVPAFLVLALVSQRASGDWKALIVALTVFGWMSTLRVVWSLGTSLRERDYVTAARFMGVHPLRVVVRHIVPNVGSLLVVTFTLGVVATVQSETALSFIGFGVALPDVSLGTMLADGADTVSSAPWLFAVPAGLVTALTVSMALISDGLRDALDPTSGAGGRA